MGFFSKLFKIKPSDKPTTQARFLNGQPSEIMPWGEDLYANSLVRSIVDKIATYVSMVRFEHVRGEGKDFAKVNDRINKLLTIKPNSFMTPSQIQYKFMTDLLIHNNAYQWIQRDDRGNPIALLPVISSETECREIAGFLFYKFTFEDGQHIVVPYSDVVHIRRFYYRNDVFGETNAPLKTDVGLQNTMNISLDASLKNGAQIKGILKHANTIDPDDLAKQEKLFRESYLRASNSGGIGMIDNKFDFIPIQYSGKITDAEQMKEVRDYVYRYFGMNNDIMLSQYNSDTWQAFHDGMVAPILNDMEQNYNIKLFTDTELDYGNRIASSVNQMTFMSPNNKIAMVKLALDGALYNRNEIRQWFGDTPIEGGDIYQYSKNFTENTTGNGGKASGKNTENDTSSEVTDSETKG